MRYNNVDKFSLELLRLFYKRETLSLNDLAAIYDVNFFSFAKPIDYLIAIGYLEIDTNYAIIHGSDLTPESPIILTQKGKIALESELTNRRIFIFTEFRAWFTLAIAVISLIVSIVAIINA